MRGNKHCSKSFELEMNLQISSTPANSVTILTITCQKQLFGLTELEEVSCELLAFSLLCLHCTFNPNTLPYGCARILGQMFSILPALLSVSGWVVPTPRLLIRKRILLPGHFSPFYLSLLLLFWQQILPNHTKMTVFSFFIPYTVWSSSVPQPQASHTVPLPFLRRFYFTREVKVTPLPHPLPQIPSLCSGNTINCVILHHIHTLDLI